MRKYNFLPKCSLIYIFVFIYGKSLKPLFLRMAENGSPGKSDVLSRHLQCVQMWIILSKVYNLTQQGKEDRSMSVLCPLCHMSKHVAWQ